jgi:hypothetical protein
MEGLEKSLSAAEAMVSAEQGAKRSVTDQSRHCLNCSTALTDLYCPHCGQKDIPRRQSLAELSFSFISSFSGYESKFLKTCRYLLLKPGFLATEYNAGKRESYFHPARMYVFISFIYFLLFTSLPDSNEKSLVTITSGNDTEDVDYNKSDDGDEAIETRAQYDSIQQSLNPQDQDGWLTKKWKYKEIELTNQFEADPKGFASRVINGFTAHFSQVFFFLLPIFAFLLWLLYIRKDFFYYEHLVFSICYYNFFFLAGSFAMLANSVPWLRWLGILLELAIVVYLLFAMKAAYKETWRKTIWKYAVFIGLFGICIALGLLTNLLITLMFI